MSHLYQCDRCQAFSKQCETVIGADLCDQCMADLRAWVAAGTLRFKPARKKANGHSPRNAPAVSLAACALVADASGVVSARAFSEATQEDYRASYQRLRHLHRKGLIDRVSGSIYRLKAEAAE